MDFSSSKKILQKDGMLLFLFIFINGVLFPIIPLYENTVNHTIQ